MRAWSLLLLLVACTGPTVGDSDDTDTADTEAPVDTGDSDTTPLDRDDDGWTDDEDCNDLDPRVNPGAEEIPWNEVDDDCDGHIDASGTLEGATPVRFQIVYEGRRYTFDVSCPTTLTRTVRQIDLEIVCRPPDDPVARLGMGEAVTIRNTDNVVETDTFAGAVEVSSTDGWSVDGTAALSWPDLDTVTGTVTMRSRFAGLDGAIALSR